MSPKFFIVDHKLRKDSTTEAIKVKKILVKHKINAKKTTSSRSSIYIEILVKDAKHLYEITKGLESIPDVYSVERLLASSSEFNLFEKNSRL